MLVSVLIPVRNMKRYIRAAASSILRQEGVEFELIVIDDGSTDDSRAIVESLGDPRVRIINGPQRGIAAAVNAGLEASRGDFYCRCDADDRFAPGRLARQAGFLLENPQFAAVCGQFATMTPGGTPLAEMGSGDSPAEITREILEGTLRTHLGTYMVRGHIARALRFRPSLGGAEDLDFAFRLGETGRVWFEPCIEYFYRLHHHSLTHTQRDRERDYYERSVRQMQAERRATGSDLMMRGGTLPPPPNEGSLPASAQRQIAGILVGAAWRYRAQGRTGKALWTGVRACRFDPVSVRTWRNLAVLAVRKPRQSAGPEAGGR